MDLHPRWTASVHLAFTPARLPAAGPGRGLLLPLADASGKPVRVADGGDRLDRIRERVRAGFYASPAGVHALAQSLVASGAL